MQSEAKRAECDSAVEFRRVRIRFDRFSPGARRNFRAMTRLAVLASLLLLTSCSHEAPVGQSRLSDMRLDAFKRQFNAAPGRRLVVMLSPT
jgi:hypothetical protein